MSELETKVIGITYSGPFHREEYKRLMELVAMYQKLSDHNQKMIHQMIGELNSYSDPKIPQIINYELAAMVDINDSK